MSVLIKGMDFPTKENFMTQLYLICDEDGYWYAVDTTNKDLYKLIEVKEPHGRLVDADKLNTYDLSPVNGFCVIGVTEEDIGLAETILGAEGSKE